MNSQRSVTKQKIDEPLRPYVKFVDGWKTSAHFLTDSRMHHVNERFEGSPISGFSHGAPRNINSEELPVLSPAIYCRIPLVTYSKEFENVMLSAKYLMIPGHSQEADLLLDQYTYYEPDGRPMRLIEKKGYWSEIISRLLEGDRGEARLKHLEHKLKYEINKDLLNKEMMLLFQELEGELLSNYFFNLGHLVNNL